MGEQTTFKETLYVLQCPNGNRYWSNYPNLLEVGGTEQRWHHPCEICGRDCTVIGTIELDRFSQEAPPVEEIESTMEPVWADEEPMAEYP